MEQCPHCQRIMTMLSEEIHNGVVKVKHHTQAPSGVRGFPHFVSGNKTHTGAPRSKSDLFEKLGVSHESYSDCSNTSWPSRDCSQKPRWPGDCSLYTYGWWKTGVL